MHRFSRHKAGSSGRAPRTCTRGETFTQRSIQWLWQCQAVLSHDCWLTRCSFAHLTNRSGAGSACSLCTICSRIFMPKSLTLYVMSSVHAAMKKAVRFLATVVCSLLCSANFGLL